MIFRNLNHTKDQKDIHNIWIECGWIEDEVKDKKALDIFTSTSHCKVVEVQERAECLIVMSPGVMKYGKNTLSISAVSSINVSRLLRKQGAASKLLASMIREDMEKGTPLSGLGMFEQGFYNRLGFATMAYANWYSFDPSKLRIYSKGGIPLRISSDDYLEAWKCYSGAEKYHGFITLDPPELMQAEMMWTKNGFGLGYETDGELSHYLWMGSEDPENGPYTVHWMAFKNWDQFLELLGILKTLEDQVFNVRMKEPVYVQLQDFIEKPFQLQSITGKSKFESKMRSIAYQQLRICNLESCIEAVVSSEPEFSFNLTLTDPLNNYLEEDNQINTCQGDFTVTIGKKSSVVRGHRSDLPLIRSTINGFTRLWIGVLPAETIGMTEDILIDEQLKEPLKKVFYQPDVQSDWNY